MRVSSSFKYSRDIRNLITWIEYIGVQTVHKEGQMSRDEMELDSIFTFGKYKGEMLEDVIKDNPSYMEWLVENDVVPLSLEVMKLLSERKII